MTYKPISAICHICTGSGIIRRQRYVKGQLVGSGAGACRCAAGDVYRRVPLGRPLVKKDLSPG